jgi:hypothetical protein
MSLFTAAASGREAKDALGRDRLSERRACRVLGQHRNTQRRQRHVPDDLAHHKVAGEPAGVFNEDDLQPVGFDPVEQGGMDGCAGLE